MEKKNLLFINSRCPIPPFLKGDQKRSFEFLKVLKKEYSVDLITFYDLDLTVENKKWLDDLVGSYQVFKRTRTGALKHMFFGALTFRPFHHSYFFDLKAKKAIEELISKKKYDVVFCQLSRVTGYMLDKTIDGLKVADLQDCYSDNMARRAENESSLLYKFAYRYESLLEGRVERKIMRGFDEILFVSRRDAAKFKQYQDKIEIIPVAVDVDRFEFKERELLDPVELLIFGNMGYFPNYEAAIWFIKEAWPLVKRKLPNVRLKVVGVNPPGKLKQLRTKDIEVTGFVDSLKPYLEGADLAVLPISAGSGMQNKILESLISGLPVICSRHVVGGSSNLEKFVEVAERTPHTFAEALVGFLKSDKRRREMTRSGSDYVRKEYSVGAVGAKLLKVLNKSVNMQAKK